MDSRGQVSWGGPAWMAKEMHHWLMLFLIPGDREGKQVALLSTPMAKLGRLSSTVGSVCEFERHHFLHPTKVSYNSVQHSVGSSKNHLIEQLGSRWVPASQVSPSWLSPLKKCVCRKVHTSYCFLDIILSTLQSSYLQFS